MVNKKNIVIRPEYDTLDSYLEEEAREKMKVAFEGKAFNIGKPGYFVHQFTPSGSVLSSWLQKYAEIVLPGVIVSTDEGQFLFLFGKPAEDFEHNFENTEPYIVLYRRATPVEIIKHRILCHHV